MKLSIIIILPHNYNHKYQASRYTTGFGPGFLRGVWSRGDSPWRGVWRHVGEGGSADILFYQHL